MSAINANLPLKRNSSARGRGGGGRGSRRRSSNASSSRRRVTILPNDIGLFERNHSASVIQRLIRLKLARLYARKLVHQVYTKIYDKKEGQYYYLNNRTGVKFWRPPIIFETLGLRMKETHIIPDEPEAAARIQKLYRVTMARMLLKAIAHDKIEKHFNEKTRLYYYLDSRTRLISDTKPICLGLDDIEVEMFKHRNGICLITSSMTSIGSGCLVRFGKFNCILTDCTALPTASVAANARAQFNYKPGAVAFMVKLSPEVFFISSKTALTTMPCNEQLDFSLCAVNEADFSAANATIYPITLDLNDKKLCCASCINLHDQIEIVGHPHAKLRTIVTKKVLNLLPHTINAKWLRYDTSMESGASGSIVFNRSGRMVGLHHQAKLRDEPNECTLISAILEYVHLAVTPPMPLIMSTSVGHESITVAWEMPFGHITLNGFEYEFELECTERNRKAYDRYENAYRGEASIYTINKLKSSQTYSVRCRIINYMLSGAWSFPLRIKTMPAIDDSWRLRFCQTFQDVFEMMVQNPKNETMHQSATNWIIAKLMDAKSTSTFTDDILMHNGIQILMDSLKLFPDSYDHGIRVMYILYVLASDLAEMRASLASAENIDIILNLLGKFEHAEELSQWTLACLGYIASGYEAAKVFVVVGGGVSAILSCMKVYNTDAGVICEGSYLLAMLSLNYEECKYQVGLYGGMTTLATSLERFSNYPKLIYWVCLALGNLALGYESNRNRAFKLGVVAKLFACRTYNAERLVLLEEQLVSKAIVAERLKAFSIANQSLEIDAADKEVEDTKIEIDELKGQNIRKVVNYALDQVMTPEEKSLRKHVKNIFSRMMTDNLRHAFDLWVQSADTIYKTEVMKNILFQLQCSKLQSAFRLWESNIRIPKKPPKVKQRKSFLGKLKKKNSLSRILALE